MVCGVCGEDMGVSKVGPTCYVCGVAYVDGFDGKRTMYLLTGRAAVWIADKFEEVPEGSLCVLEEACL